MQKCVAKNSEQIAKISKYEKMIQENVLLTG